MNKYFDEETGIFNYPCPCGDKFTITLVNFFSIINKKEMIKDK